MSDEQFATLCKENLRLSEDFDLYGNSVTISLEVFNGKKFELINSLHIHIPDGD